jgi:hypothetical protein
MLSLALPKVLGRDFQFADTVAKIPKRCGRFVRRKAEQGSIAVLYGIRFVTEVADEFIADGDPHSLFESRVSAGKSCDQQPKRAFGAVSA